MALSYINKIQKTKTEMYEHFRDTVCMTIHGACPDREWSLKPYLKIEFKRHYAVVMIPYATPEDYRIESKYDEVIDFLSERIQRCLDQMI